MSDPNALAYVTFAAEKLELPLSEEELEHAARRAVAKRASLASLYQAARNAPTDGAITFRARNASARDD